MFACDVYYYTRTCIAPKRQPQIFSSTNLTFYRYFSHNYTLYLYLLCSYIFTGSKGVLFIYIFLVLSLVLRILVLRVSDNMEAILDLDLAVVSTDKKLIRNKE